MEEGWLVPHGKGGARVRRGPSRPSVTRHRGPHKESTGLEKRSGSGGPKVVLAQCELACEEWVKAAVGAGES